MENALLRREDRSGVPRSWRTRDEAENAIFAYIDGSYNTERIQLVSVAVPPLCASARAVFLPGVGKLR